MTYRKELDKLVSENTRKLNEQINKLRDKYDWGRKLIEHALSLGYKVAFSETEDARHVQFPEQNIEALWKRATDEEIVRVYFFEVVEDKPRGRYWALLVHGNEPDETINDYVATNENGRTWIDIWWELQSETEED